MAAEDYIPLEDFVEVFDIGSPSCGRNYGRERSYGHGYDPRKDRSAVTAEAVIVAQTPKAYLFNFGHGHECWLPKSQIDAVENSDGIVTVRIPAWLADQHEIAGDAQ